MIVITSTRGSGQAAKGDDGFVVLFFSEALSKAALNNLHFKCFPWPLQGTKLAFLMPTRTDVGKDNRTMRWMKQQPRTDKQLKDTESNSLQPPHTWRKADAFGTQFIGTIQDQSSSTSETMCDTDDCWNKMNLWRAIWLCFSIQF